MCSGHESHERKKVSFTTSLTALVLQVPNWGAEWGLVQVFSVVHKLKKILGECSNTFVNQNDKRKESIDIF